MKARLFAGIITSVGLFWTAAANADDAKPSAPPPKAKVEATTKLDGPKPSSDWTVFQVGIVPGAPSATVNSTVRGMKLGLPMSSGDNYVAGIEPSFLYSGTNYVDGIQAAWAGASVARSANGIQGAWFGYVQAREMNGLQCSIGACVADEMNGFQAALGNVSLKESNGCQISCVNVNADVFNGFQFSIANIASGKFYGFQGSAANISSKRMEGFQLGAVNYSKKGGLQFGVVNIISNAWIPVLPLVNYAPAGAE